MIHSRNILLCEDDPVQLAILEAAFHKAGHDTLSARTPFEAIEQMRKGTPAAIVTDVCLEKGNAFDLMDSLSRIGTDAPVIMGSGYATAGMHRRALAAGAKKLFEKPYDLPELLECTEKAIRNMRLHRIGACVLVVEDHAPVRRLMVQALEHGGFSTLAAEDGEKALSVLRTKGRSIAMVLCDIHLPGLHGADLIREMRRVIPGLWVTMITGEGVCDDIQAGYRAGAAALIRKPFSFAGIAGYLKADLPLARVMRRDADLRAAAPWFRRALRRLRPAFYYPNGSPRKDQWVTIGLSAVVVLVAFSVSEVYERASQSIAQYTTRIDGLLDAAERRVTGGDDLQRRYLWEKLQLDRDANAYTRRFYEEQINLMRVQPGRFPDAPESSLGGEAVRKAEASK